MAQSELEVANYALDLVGANSITSLSDNVREAQLCSRMLPIARRAVLRDNVYNFSARYETLTAEDPTPTPNPIPEFPAIFDLTNLTEESLRVWAVKRAVSDATYEGPQAIDRWKVSSIWLGTLLATVDITYGTDVTDYLLWDPSAYESLGGYLAYKLALPLTQSETVQDRILREYTRLRQVAQNRSGLEGTKDRFHTPNRLLGVRQGSYGVGWNW